MRLPADGLHSEDAPNERSVPVTVSSHQAALSQRTEPAEQGERWRAEGQHWPWATWFPGQCRSLTLWLFHPKELLSLMNNEREKTKFCGLDRTWQSDSFGSSVTLHSCTVYRDGDELILSWNARTGEWTLFVFHVGHLRTMSCCTKLLAKVSGTNVAWSVSISFPLFS